jgi:hypothetical protein
VPVGRNQTQVAVVVFGSSAQVHFNLSFSVNKTELRTKILQVRLGKKKTKNKSMC